jgi:tyrosinase
MRITSLLSLGCILAAVSSAAVVPPDKSLQKCRNPPKRVEWYIIYSVVRLEANFGYRRQLPKPQKKSYIDAVLCLTKKNAISGIANALNRFDDHEAVHNNQKPDIHWVGHFILWHRYFLATYEKALRDECGYTGGQPYVLGALSFLSGS